MIIFNSYVSLPEGRQPCDQLKSPKALWLLTVGCIYVAEQALADAREDGRTYVR